MTVYIQVEAAGVQTGEERWREKRLRRRCQTWLQKSSKRTRTVAESNDDSSTLEQSITTPGNGGLTPHASISISSVEPAAATQARVAVETDAEREVNNNIIRQEDDEWPDCWSKDQVVYCCSQNNWLIAIEGKLSWKVCCKVCSLGAQTEQGLRMSSQWSGCLISAFGNEKWEKHPSLQKKIKEHRDSSCHIKAVGIGKMASDREMEKEIQYMHKAEYDTTCRVFRTAYKNGKHGTGMPSDVKLQELNGVSMDRVLHSNNTCAEIIDHVSTEMKIVDDIVKNRRKLCVLIDESTTISCKSVLGPLLLTKNQAQYFLSCLSWMGPQQMISQTHCWDVFISMALITSF